MKKIFIKYNPYMLKTEIIVDEKQINQDSLLSKYIHSKIYIQEWLEELPHILVKEYGDMDFDVVFYGTWQDFEDLKEVFAQECEREKITARLRRIPAKEVTDIEKLLDGILRKMQNAPFDELRDIGNTKTFQYTNSKEFEVYIVSTLSAGKIPFIGMLHSEPDKKSEGIPPQSLVFCILEGNFEEEGTLLQQIAECIKAGGEYNEGRFIFVVNNPSDCKKNDDNISWTLDFIQTKLGTYGISKPNIIPARFFVALNIRFIQVGIENIKEVLYFKAQAYISLSVNIYRDMKIQIEEAREKQDINNVDFILSGAISIETIYEYFERYAKVERLRKTVGIFQKKFSETICLEKIKMNLKKVQENRGYIEQQISNICKEIDDVEKIQLYNRSIHKIIIEADQKVNSKIKGFVDNYKVQLIENTHNVLRKKLNKNEIKEILENLIYLAENLDTDFQAFFDELSDDGNRRIEEYKENIFYLIGELDPEPLTGVAIVPFKMMNPNNIEAEVCSLKRVIKETEKKNEENSCYCMEDGKLQFDFQDEVLRFFYILTDIINNSASDVQINVAAQVKYIKYAFEEECISWDDTLSKKIAELENLTANREAVILHNRKLEQNVQWLGKLKHKVESLLEF